MNAKSSTRAYRQFLKENPDFDRDTLDRITASQKAMDFYPTPEKCLDYKPITDCIGTAKHILEPTAGLGSIAHAIDKWKSAKTKVDINELNRNFIPILEKFFPKFKTTQDNFLEMKNDNDYDVIICNPPFSIGNNKKAYLDFLFKCIYMLNTSKTSSREKCLIFICPKIVEHKRSWKAGDFNGFDFLDVMKKIPFANMSRICNEINGTELNKKDYKAYQDGEEYEELDSFMPYQSEWVDECKGFGGTGITADVYRFILV